MNETRLLLEAASSNYSLVTSETALANQTTTNQTSTLFAYSFSPNAFEWCLLVFAFTIFVVGIIGNLLVIIVVAKNVHMRTITNIFIVNLAIGDFFVILICLPPSVITDIAGSWWFGETMCKIIPYVQYISVCVSVMTLTSISYERYYAIVYPLKFQATKFRAKIILFVIWVLAIFINLPHPIVIIMQEENGMFYCYPTWNVIFQNMFDLFMFAILYILPMSLIFYTYRRVIKVLWKIDKSIAWDESPSSNNNQNNNTNSSTNTNTNATTNNGREQRSTGQMTATTYSFSKKGGSGKNSATASSTGDDLASTAVVIADSNTNKSNISSSNLSNKNNANLNSSSLKPPPPSYTAYTMANGSSAAMNKMKNQLIARRKAAKMLISVAVMFAICYLPIHILNITRFIGSNLLERVLGDYTIIIFQIAHCLVYVNSCVNPLIYNFMSDNFRKEFRKILFCNMMKPGAHNSDLLANELKIRYLNGASNGRMTPAGHYSNAEHPFGSGKLPSSRNNSNSNYRLYE